MWQDPFKIAFGEPSDSTPRKSPKSGADRLFEKAFGRNGSIQDATNGGMHVSARFVRPGASMGRAPLEFGETAS